MQVIFTDDKLFTLAAEALDPNNTPDEAKLGEPEGAPSMSMRTTKAQRDAWSDHADRLMTRDNPNELVLSAAHTLDLLADLDASAAIAKAIEAEMLPSLPQAPPSRTFDDGLRRVLEKLIAATQNLVDNWYPDVDQATALSSIDEMLADARAILSEVSTATQPDETIDKMLEAHGSGQERGYNDGLRRAAEIARNFGDLYCRDSPCPTCEHIAQAILAELTSTTQPTRSLLASPELVEQIKHLAELVGLKFIPFGDKP